MVQSEQNNFCVIMAGGIGSRFWPCSRNRKPKQFLDFFGTGRSLLQTTVDRFANIFPKENIYIVTNMAYRDIVMEQLPFLDVSQILCEPMRRNTAPCIAYAMTHIRNSLCRRAGVPVSAPDEEINLAANVVVAPCDHLIVNETRFLQIIRHGLDFVASHDVLVTLGIRPTRPETGYGYIQIDSAIPEQDGICKVKTFTEKPNLEVAKAFVDSGEFLWNSGIFIWNLPTILQSLHLFVPGIARIFAEGIPYIGTDREAEYIKQSFQSCPNISIDYGVMEKAKEVYVIPSDFGWSDLGTWGALYEISRADENKNVVLTGLTELNNCSGNVVALTKDKLLVMDDMHDLIVVETDDAILICPKNNEQSIKQLVSNIEDKFSGKYN